MTPSGPDRRSAEHSWREYTSRTWRRAGGRSPLKCMPGVGRAPLLLTHPLTPSLSTQDSHLDEARTDSFRTVPSHHLSRPPSGPGQPRAVGGTGEVQHRADLRAVAACAVSRKVAVTLPSPSAMGMMGQSGIWSRTAVASAWAALSPAACASSQDSSQEQLLQANTWPRSPAAWTMAFSPLVKRSISGSAEYPGDFVTPLFARSVFRPGSGQGSERGRP